MWCRLRFHHTWHTERTEDNATYRRCLACGADDETIRRRSLAGGAYGMTGVHPN